MKTNGNQIEYSFRLLLVSEQKINYSLVRSDVVLEILILDFFDLTARLLDTIGRFTTNRCNLRISWPHNKISWISFKLKKNSKADMSGKNESRKLSWIWLIFETVKKWEQCNSKSLMHFSWAFWTFSIAVRTGCSLWPSV